ncbi:MAG: 50S ribosomal protein L18 [Deltaproteobacteria bacterium]|nr:50S ribosomal protein L18 [Deltaproteobacteria bacterium]
MAITEARRLWARRKQRVRRQLRMTDRPLLTVYRSAKHMYAQIVDPITGRTIAGASTRTPAVRAGLKTTGDVDAAKKVGTAIAELALTKEIREVSFNRNGFVYTGRVKALADAAREAGLRF